NFRSDQAQPEWSAQSLFNLPWIQPWSSEGIADKADRGLNPEFREHLLTIARLIFEKLAHQEKHQAVTETLAGFKDIDVILVILLLIGIDIRFTLTFALEQMFAPEGGEGDLLAAVDGDRIAVVDQLAGELHAPDQTVPSSTWLCSI
ncbi:MAG: hypothetical protein GY731_14800, partial [Gammaproteobacteria bacterium]|nr:hypothetical protein [Gammaproteobacteria bacterium]